MDELLLLKHDLHKLGFFYSHKEIFDKMDSYGRKADSIASWFSRNCFYQKFNKNLFRYSIITRNFLISKNLREFNIELKNLVNQLFDETDPTKLHTKILNNKILNYYAESRCFPYTSLKYHLLLTTAIYYNLKNGFKLFKLYLSTNSNEITPYQKIFEYKGIKLFITPERGISRIYNNFSKTWMRRTKTLLNDRFINAILSQIKSWSCALVTLEDYLRLNWNDGEK